MRGRDGGDGNGAGVEIVSGAGGGAGAGEADCMPACGSLGLDGDALASASLRSGDRRRGTTFTVEDFVPLPAPAPAPEAEPEPVPVVVPVPVPDVVAVDVGVVGEVGGVVAVEEMGGSGSGVNGAAARAMITATVSRRSWQSRAIGTVRCSARNLPSVRRWIVTRRVVRLRAIVTSVGAWPPKRTGPSCSERTRERRRGPLKHTDGATRSIATEGPSAHARAASAIHIKEARRIICSLPCNRFFEGFLLRVR